MLQSLISYQNMTYIARQRKTKETGVLLKGRKIKPSILVVHCFKNLFLWKAFQWHFPTFNICFQIFSSCWWNKHIQYCHTPAFCKPLVKISPLSTTFYANSQTIVLNQALLNIQQLLSTFLIFMVKDQFCYCSEMKETF